MSAFVTTLPADIDSAIAKWDISAPVIQVSTDMVAGSEFGTAWLVVTHTQVLLISPNAIDDPRALALDAVREVTNEPRVGGGVLHLASDADNTIEIFYSNSLADRFAEVAEAISRIKAGKTANLPVTVEATHCHVCHRLLPSRGGQCPACIKKTDTLRRLMRLFIPYRGKALLMVGLTLFTSILSLAPPYITKRIIDDVLTVTAPATDLYVFASLLLGLNIVIMFADVIRRWLNNWVGFRAIEDLRADLFRALQFLPIRSFNKRKMGSLVSRMNNDSDLVEDYLIFDAPFVLSNAVIIVGILSILMAMNWQLALLVLLPIPPIIFGGSLVWARMQGFWRRWSIHWASLATHLNESIGGIRVVKAFTQEARESARFDGRNHALRDVSVSAERSWLVFFLVTNFFMGLGAYFVWYFGGRKILAGDLQLGELMAFIAYLWMLYQPLRWFGDFYSFMVRAYAGAERIFEVIDGPSEPFDKPGEIAMPEVSGAIRFNNVAFGYDPGKMILHDVNLDIKAGEMIGLVGKSGVGKSTLVNLITRFYDASRGQLLIDDVDITRVSLADLRGQIGYVAQQSFLFNGSIADNIRYGRPDAPMADVIRAARAANAHEFIVARDDGYDMLAGELGGKLSGGEKQRIAIARAILHDPRILILDEATSSLDTPTEKKIQEAIARLVRGRTTFAIAHRLSTLRSADRLVVLDGGSVEEVGTHAELMAQKGIFYRLVQTQQASSAVMAQGTTETSNHE
jgi:ATP-binding cassette subfamily B protein